MAYRQNLFLTSMAFQARSVRFLLMSQELIGLIDRKIRDRVAGTFRLLERRKMGFLTLYKDHLTT